MRIIFFACFVGAGTYKVKSACFWRDINGLYELWKNGKKIARFSIAHTYRVNGAYGAVGVPQQKRQKKNARFCLPDTYRVKGRIKGCIAQPLRNLSPDTLYIGIGR